MQVAGTYVYTTWFDFDNDELITSEDIRIMLSYMPF